MQTKLMLGVWYAMHGVLCATEGDRLFSSLLFIRKYVHLIFWELVYFKTLAKSNDSASRVSLSTSYSVQSSCRDPAKSLLVIFGIKFSHTIYFGKIV